MKLFKKIAAGLMAGVIMMSALVTVSSAESIEKTAKEIESGKTYSTTMNYGDTVVYKMNLTEAGKIKVSTAFYRKEVCFSLLDANGDAVDCKSGDINVKTGNLVWNYTSFFALKWNSNLEKGAASVTYNVEKKEHIISKYMAGQTRARSQSPQPSPRQPQPKPMKRHTSP